MQTAKVSFDRSKALIGSKTLKNKVNVFAFLLSWVYEKEKLQIVSKYLGQGIASLINVFDPEVVIIAGGVRENGNKFLNMIEKEVKKYQIIPRNVEIKFSKLEHPGVLGASLLVR